MGEVAVRFVGGPADGLLRELPAGPDGDPPTQWVVRHPDGDPPAGGAGPDHLYARHPRDGTGTWTMRFVRTYPLGAGE
ncbi:hypothetical protein E1193_19280 [Micromonospora sp. KC606]|uniref:hypothetical protein n=1 Tax=Micromonospora sp. KC606 TaxID=2530379 RepID=UPI00104E25E1|nr:hypothetical protein [Micromonospora sp. KC606]TDC79329.1 hypothetical protein E1193_19280 [Micromonospora sp. KC606]